MEIRGETVGDGRACSPLLARLGGAALEGTGGPLLELWRSLLLGRVCHFMLKKIIKYRCICFVNMSADSTCGFVCIPPFL